MVAMSVATIGISSRITNTVAKRITLASFRMLGETPFCKDLSINFGAEITTFF